MNMLGNFPNVSSVPGEKNSNIRKNQYFNNGGNVASKTSAF